MGAKKDTFFQWVLGWVLLVWHVNASHGLGSDILAGLSVIAILRFKLFRLFLKPQYDYTVKPDQKLRITILLPVYRYQAAPGAQRAPYSNHKKHTSLIGR